MLGEENEIEWKKVIFPADLISAQKLVEKIVTREAAYEFYIPMEIEFPIKKREIFLCQNSVSEPIEFHQA